MDEVQEGDGYSDDDLDALPADAFQELQENAIRLTQQPNTSRNTSASNRPPTKSTANLTGGIGGFSFARTTSQQGHAPAHPEPPSSDYGEFDDEMLDGEIYDAAEQPAIPVSRNNAVLTRVAGDSSQREEWRQQRYGGLPQLPRYKEQLRSNKNPGDFVVQNQGGRNAAYNFHQPDEMPLSRDGEDVEGLRAQIQKVCLCPET